MAIKVNKLHISCKFDVPQSINTG